MKKTEMIENLSKQHKEAQKDIETAQLVIDNRREIKLKIEGALEALNALDPDEPPTTTSSAPDHTEAAIALGVFKQSDKTVINN